MERDELEMAALEELKQAKDNFNAAAHNYRTAVHLSHVARTGHSAFYTGCGDKMMVDANAHLVKFKAILDKLTSGM